MTGKASETNETEAPGPPDPVAAGLVAAELASLTPTRAGPGAPGPRPDRRRWPALALGLLVAIVVLELAGGPVLRARPGSHPEAAVLAIPGVAGMVHDAQVDPTELTQVAAQSHPSSPRAWPAMALLDGLLLVIAAAVIVPRLLPDRGLSRAGRVGSFVGSLVLLVAGMAVAVAAIARLRYLVALYLSPPFGTLSYLLGYGSFRRGPSLAMLALLMALKIGAAVALFAPYPTSRDSVGIPRAGAPSDRRIPKRPAYARGIAGLMLPSVAATVVTTFAYAVAPSTLVSITDALAAAVAALLAIGWAGVILSGNVRRLA